MDVTDVLRDRIGEPEGFERMAVVSLLLHAVVVATVVFVPGGWFSAPPTPPKTVMTISLSGGNGGPNAGGMTSIGARPVQAQAPPEAPKRPEPVRPPAPKAPANSVPIPKKLAAPPKPVPQAPAVEHAPDEARGRTPTKGPETRDGTAIAETGARGLGFGLSTSGGMGTGSTLDITGDFCCPDYLTFMIEKIRTNWSARAEVPGQVMVKYTIRRDGTIVSPELEQSSGYTALDVNALRAVAGTRQVLPLPAAFPNPSLTVHLSFQYTR